MDHHHATVAQEQCEREAVTVGTVSPPRAVTVELAGDGDTPWGQPDRHLWFLKLGEPYQGLLEDAAAAAGLPPEGWIANVLGHALVLEYLLAQPGGQPPSPRFHDLRARRSRKAVANGR